MTDTKKSDRVSKSGWGASEIIVDNDYKPGGTAIVAFGKTTRRVIQHGIDDLGRWSWMAFEGEDNKVILIISNYQCCKKPTNPQGKTAKRVIQQGMDDLRRWSWMAFKGEDNKVILVMSIYQCC